jgi:hypothetical protein
VLILGSDYSVTGGDTGDGPAVGSITLLTSSIAGSKLRIDRFTKRSQELHYEPGDDFPARSHEDGLDRAEMQIQELDRDATTAEKVRDVIAAALRAGKGIELIVDDEANTITIVNTGLTDIDGIVDAVLAALGDCLLLSGDQQTGGTGGTGGSGGGTSGLDQFAVYILVKSILTAGANITITADDELQKLTLAATGAGSGSGGGGGDFEPHSAMLSELTAVGISADKIWVGDGTDTVKLVAISAYMQALLASANAAAVAAAIGSLAVSAATLANPGFVKFSNGLIINWGSTFCAGGAAATVATYAQAFATFSICVGSGGPTGSGKDAISVQSCGTTTASFANNSSDGGTFFWIAIGK